MNAAVETGLVRVDSWKLVCQDCCDEFENGEGWSVFAAPAYAVDDALDSDWVVREGLVLCSACRYRAVCMDEDDKCTRRDLTEAEDGWMYCPDHISQGMDDEVDFPSEVARALMDDDRADR